MTGIGPPGGSRLIAYLAQSIVPEQAPPEHFAFDAFPGFSGGVFVG